MIKSPLASYANISKYNGGQRKSQITRITPHCIVGQWSAKKLADYFHTINGRQASSNYGIGFDGQISLSTPEEYRSYCSSNRDNDDQAITIEIASDTNHPYTMNQAAYSALIQLCFDICARYKKKKLLWIPDKKTALSYKLQPDEMLLTVHRWFASKACPGDWLYNRLGEVASQVTIALGGHVIPVVTEPSASAVLYKIQVGAYKRFDNAMKMVDKMRSLGYDVNRTEEKDITRVYVLAQSHGEAVRLSQELTTKGFKNFIL